MKGEDITATTNYSVNSQAFVLEATLTISMKKITSEVKFAERKSALKQESVRKILPFVHLQSNPNRCITQRTTL